MFFRGVILGSFATFVLVARVAAQEPIGIDAYVAIVLRAHPRVGQTRAVEAGVSTEFGRTVFANGSRGTDHGSGYCALVLGGKVRGGRVLGRWPGLAKDQLFEERDLAVTTDFRDVFLEVTRQHLGVEAGAAMFPGYRPGAALNLWG